MDKKQFGQFAEEEVARYCELVWGLSILERRAYFREGELDLVAKHPSSNRLIFIEVKARRSERFGSVVESLTPEKFRRMKRASIRWRMRQNDAREARYLFVGLFQKKGQPFTLEWSSLD